MRLTAYTDYALRVLIRLALQPDCLTRIADIAKSYGISENHLMKVVHQLGVAGVIDTVRRETVVCVCANHLPQSASARSSA